MASEKPQNFQNHAKFVPPFHMFVLPVFLLNAGWTIYHLIKAGISFETVLGVLMGFALLVFALFSRLSARNAAAPRRSFARGFAAAHSGVHRGAAGLAALRAGRRTAGSRPQSP